MRTILLPITLILVIITTSCEKDAKNVKIPEFVPKVVVSAFISPCVDTLSVILNNNVPAFGRSDDVSYVDNATVVISDGQVNAAFINIKDGNYYLPREAFAIDYGKNYHLTISTPEGLSGEASCMVPNMHNWDTAIDTIRGFVEGFNSFDEDYRYSFRFKDIPDEKNYYRVVAYRYEYYRGLPQVGKIYIENELQTDWGRDGKEMEIATDGNIYYESGADSAFIRFYLLNVDYDYYTYHKTCRDYTGGEDPFTEVAPIYSNINGGLGIFCSYAQQVTSLRLK